VADPFVEGLAALFRAAGSSAAVYRPLAGESVSLRVIVDRQSATADAMGTPVRMSAGVMQIRRVDIARPSEGAEVDLIDDANPASVIETYRIASPPELDSEGLTWLVEAEPLD